MILRYCKIIFRIPLVIESKTNNMMASYNLALTEILRDPEINAIMQICNDIRLEKGLEEAIRFLV